MRREAKDPFILSSLDIGTKKISFVVTENDPDSFDMQVIFAGSARSRGVRKGDILDSDLCVESIRSVIDEAESSLGLHVDETVISFGPSLIDSFIIDQTITLHEEGTPARPVTSGDMKMAVDAAMAASGTRSQESLLHAIPLDYSVDGGPPTSDPKGYKGTYLTVSLLSVCVPESSVMTAIECARKAGLKVKGIIHKSISATFGSLLPEEMEKGSVAVDIGAGTTSAAFCIDGSIRDILQFPIGGDHITSDIATILEIPSAQAEYLKREVSLAESEDSLGDELEFDIEGKAIVTSVEKVLGIISPRVDEILIDFLEPWIKAFVAERGIETVVFSGGVVASPGFMIAVNDIFQCRTRIGVPIGMSSLPPKGKDSEFVSSIGVFNYLSEKDRNRGFYLEPFFTEMTAAIDKGYPPRDHKRGKGFLAGMIQELKHAFRELF